ncbi:histidinol dehydrogenase, partial [mine drainage metagenome]
SDGVRARLEVQPLRRVGIYAPAGRAPLLSSVLMIAAAARAAGVGEIALASPPGPGGDVSPYILLAADVAGVDEIYRIGGAQAIAAFAYGSDEIPAVDKIAGPGNRYVAAAKREVYGAVDVDLVAGPSEVLVVADFTAEPEIVAADLLAQAEHDPDAEVALLALTDGVVGAVRAEL